MTDQKVIGEEFVDLHTILTNQCSLELSIEEAYEVGRALIDFFEILAEKEENV